MKIKALVDTAVQGKPFKKDEVLSDCPKEDAQYLIALGFAVEVKTPTKKTK